MAEQDEDLCIILLPHSLQNMHLSTGASLKVAKKPNGSYFLVYNWTMGTQLMRGQCLPRHCVTVQKPLFHISIRLRFKNTAREVIKIQWKCFTAAVWILFKSSVAKHDRVSLTYWISVSRIERVESSVKHPELPGSSRSVHRLWSWENKHSGKLQRRSVSHVESSIDLDCSLAPARSFSGCVWWLRTGSRRRLVSGHLWVCARSAPALIWRQSKHTS